MTFSSHWSVRTFLIWLALVCLLPGVIGATALFIHEYEVGRAEQIKETTQTARALVQTVDSNLLRAQAVAQTLAFSDALANGDFESFYRLADHATEHSRFGSNVALFDAAGRQILNTAVDYGKPLPKSNGPSRKVFATGKPQISDIFIGPVLKQRIISIDVPAVIDGKVMYDVSIRVPLEQFDTILKTQHLPSSYLVAIFDSSTTVAGRTHSPEKFIGKPGAPELINALTHSREGAVDANTVENIPVLAVYGRSATTGWTVAIGIPRQEMVAGLMHTLSMLAAGVITLFLVGLVFAWNMSEKIAHAVKSLTAPAIALGKGESANIPEVEVKEAAEVAQAIGRASDLLQERNRALQERDKELAEAYLLAKFGTWHWNLITDEVRASDSIREIFGRDIPSFTEQRGTLLTVESWEKMNAAAQAAKKTGKGYDLELQINHGDGHMIWINAKCEADLNEKNEVIALRGTVQDISERKLAEQQIREAALHDPLTGLPNRALIFEYCSHLMAAATRSHGWGALLFIDLDRFKPINDLYGHEIGDRVLQEVARRLVECTRHEDLAGRLGGDEFVVVLPRLDESRHRVAVVAENIIHSLNKPFHIEHYELSLSASIGISYFPEHAGNVGALIHTADLAMYQAKQSGRASYQFYVPEFDRRTEQALLMEMKLKNAIKQGSLTMHYQPVIDVRTGKLIAAEALVRLNDDDGTLIGPASFIPIAESSGLIGELGEWVAVEVCNQVRKWLQQGLKIIVAINISPIQFRQRAFAERLCSIILSSGVNPSCLEIELTESAVMKSVDEAVEILKDIKSLGVRVALDDFGTGYSSLSILSSLPIDKLKVDQSFVRRIERDKASRAVTEAIIALGRSLRLDVVGEGIESETTLRYLRENGCNLAQGFWFSQPLPASEFMQWYQQHQGDYYASTV